MASEAGSLATYILCYEYVHCIRVGLVARLNGVHGPTGLRIGMGTAGTSSHRHSGSDFHRRI